MADGGGSTVVVGYDGSQSARHALTYISRWGLQDASVVLVSVTATAVSPGLGAELADNALEAEQALQEARDLLQSAGHTGSVEARTATGTPAEILIETVRDVGADLLVVGRRGRDFVSRVLLGSVAEQVVQHAPCDVLVVN